MTQRHAHIRHAHWIGWHRSNHSVGLLNKNNSPRKPSKGLKYQQVCNVDPFSIDIRIIKTQDVIKNSISHATTTVVLP